MSASFIYAGEIHYFRIAPALWPRHLQRAIEARLNTVSTYIPWRWHEPQQGEFDFDGRTDPRRDLQRFISEVESAGLQLVARVGPVSNGEMVLEGLPDYLPEKLPRTMLQAVPGQAIHHIGAPAYLEPLFLQQVAAWYDRLLPRLVAHQASRGGCIVLVQLCNEIAMVNWVGKLVDRSEAATERYRAFLRRRYGTIEALNRAHGASWRGFDEIEQPPIALEQDQPAAPHWDRARFFRDYYADYFAELERAARARGVDVPVSANIPHFYDFDVRGRGLFAPLTTSLFRDFSSRVPGVVLGGAYQPRRLDWDNFHDILITSGLVRMIAAEGARTICAELQSGIMYDRPRLYPSDVGLNLLTSAASGLDGLNCYMFSGGVNPPGLGQFGTYHEWQAPVRPDGSVRSHFEAIQSVGDWLGGMGQALAASAPEQTVQVGFYAPYWMTEFVSGPLVERLEKHRAEDFFDGIGRLLLRGGHGCRFVDLEREALDPQLPLFVYTADFLDRRVQQRLGAFVREGGRLFFGPELPLLQLPGGPACTRLADDLGLEQAAVAGPMRVRLDPEHHLVFQRVVVLRPPDRGEVLLSSDDGHPVALHRRCGAGWLLFCGIPLSDRFAPLAACFDRMVSAFGARPTVELDSPDLIAVLRRGEQGSFLFLLNYHEQPLVSQARVGGEALGGPVTVPARSGVVLPLRLTIAPGVAIDHATLTVRRAHLEGRALTMRLSGAPGTRGLVALRCGAISSVQASGAVLLHQGRGTNTVRLQLRRQVARLRVQLRQAGCRATED